MDNCRKSECINPRYANPSCNTRRCNTRPMPPCNTRPMPPCSTNPMPPCNTKPMPPCNTKPKCNQCDECNSHNSYKCSDALSGLPLAMSYVPWQNWNETYELDKGLMIGTIFPELNKPFLGSRCC